MIVTVEPFLFQKLENAKSEIIENQNSHFSEFNKKIKSFVQIDFTWWQQRPENDVTYTIGLLFCLFGKRFL